MTTMTTTVTPLEDMTLSDLKLEAEKLGLDASKFTNKAPLIASINALRMKPQPVIDPFKPELPVIDNATRDDQAYKNKARRMKEQLEKQPKVKFLVPLEPGEKKGSIEVVIMNGYRMNILKGEFVDLPEQVAEDLARRYKLTSEAGKNLEIDRIDPNTGRPVSEQL